MSSRLRTLAVRTFYRLPGSAKRRIVRTVQPTYVIGAVTIVREADAPEPGRILLLRQPAGSGWSIPGGLMDRNEKPIECAARELGEETGIKVPAARLRPAHPYSIVHVGGRWGDMVFMVEVPATDSFEVDAAEVREAAWHRLDNLP